LGTYFQEFVTTPAFQYATVKPGQFFQGAVDSVTNCADCRLGATMSAA
jgi:hypothetical protein